MKAETEETVTGKARGKKTPGRAGHSQAGQSRLVACAPIKSVTFILIIALAGVSFGALAQKRPKQRSQRNVSLTSHSRDSLSPEAREMVELASAVVCKERIRDPQGSVPIDDMQGRPSLPVRSPEAITGAKRAQRLLPIAKGLVVTSLRRLAKDYGFRNSRGYDPRLRRAIARVVRRLRVNPESCQFEGSSLWRSWTYPQQDVIHFNRLGNDRGPHANRGRVRPITARQYGHCGECA